MDVRAGEERGEGGCVGGHGMLGGRTGGRGRRGEGVGIPFEWRRAEHPLAKVDFGRVNGLRF